jgi:polar amino acid transport system substrate-binding protein
MSRSRFWLVLGLIALAVTGMVVAGCGDDDDDDGGEETTATTGGGEDLGLITEGTLTVGTDTPFPPFEIGQPPDISGYDIEVMNAVAEELDLTAEYTDTSFDTIFRDVAAGQFDTAAAASTITPGRQKTVNFTDPYYEAQQALLVPEGSDITSVDQLEGAIVGAQDGTTGETYANDETGAAEVRGFPEGPDATSALISGQVDAVIIDQPVAVDAVEKQGGVEIAEEITTNELYGFAVSKENTALLDAMNEALQQLKDNGTIEQLYDQYFKTTPPDSVVTGTTENPG